MGRPFFGRFSMVEIERGGFVCYEWSCEVCNVNYDFFLSVSLRFVCLDFYRGDG